MASVNVKCRDDWCPASKLPYSKEVGYQGQCRNNLTKFNHSKIRDNIIVMLYNKYKKNCRTTKMIAEKQKREIYMYVSM